MSILVNIGGTVSEAGVSEGASVVTIRASGEGVVVRDEVSGMEWESEGVSIQGTDTGVPAQCGGAFHPGHGEVRDETERLVGELVLLGEEPSPEEYQRLQGYIMWRWGLQDRLPEGHPYRESPPVVEEELEYGEGGQDIDLGPVVEAVASQGGKLARLIQLNERHAALLEQQRRSR
ncbi:MAG: hypothetical protein MJ058_04255 [Akkermansia sp.]|nr:hypothetical protein [Akkermansia sp.]